MFVPKASTLPLKPVAPVANLGTFEGRRKHLARRAETESRIRDLVAFAMVLALIAFTVFA
ncbi:hypothetical protein [Tianweitania sediminis]|uniref:Uncharacterized protein n=1 Tax=Tianweitania sediminis TaxID=1502156 RepID=A0A8J7R1E9_9HYPH|nr:hypothetical protein [Tianweitania sediminis]MBP0438445.1 hypothetical protein [Tianweitania sediminis]